MKQLIDIYSPSGKEIQIVDFLTGYLEGAGVDTMRQPVDETRKNLIIQAQPDVDMLFIGHIDTVAAYDFDRYGFSEHEDEIYGLGAADMKGGCAAMIEAFLSYFNEKGTLPENAGLALVVGEEESGDGTMALLKEYSYPFALIGEPTGLKPCLSHYSYLEANLEAHGQRVHASLAKKGHNAIRSLLLVITELTKRLESEMPEIVYNIRDMTSSQSGFAVPEFCESYLDIHAPPSLSTSEIARTIEMQVEEIKVRHPQLNAGLTFQTIDTGYILPESGDGQTLLQKALEKEGLSWLPVAFPSHSDANLFWANGTKPMLLGPGALEKAHTSNESIEFNQVELAAKIYRNMLDALG